MSKIFSVVIAAMLSVVASGCVTVMEEGGVRQRYLFISSGVMVRVVNNCAPYLQIESDRGVLVQALPYGGSVSVPLAAEPLSRTNRLNLIVKGLGPNREYLGSYTRNFYVSPSQGTQQEVWEVDYLRLANGRGGCV